MTFDVRDRGRCSHARKKPTGRPSVAARCAIAAYDLDYLIALYPVRSEPAFCKELDFQLLYRWFLDMTLMKPSFDPTVFTKKREEAGFSASLRFGQ